VRDDTGHLGQSEQALSWQVGDMCHTGEG
jgi:hypothetical protein